MKKLNIYLIAIMLITGLGATTSCSKDDDDNNDNNNKPEEFVANNDSFKNFADWALVATNQGPDPALGPAHEGNDSTVTRYIYFKDNQAPSNGTYPLGTIIAKQSKNTDMSVNQVVAMVKRGGDFNPGGGDWEWFVLTPNGDIATDGEGNELRGAELMDGACVNCHSQAASSDYVFSR